MRYGHSALVLGLSVTMRAALVLGVVLLVAGVFSASAAPAQYTIKLVNGRYIVQTGQGGIADALFDIQSVNVTGWSTLTLTSKASPNYKPATEAYAAGYLEGTILALVTLAAPLY